MRNIFDYYKQSENQLTHALFSTLANDPALLRGFIKDICKVRGLKKNLHLSVQSYPFARAYTNKEIESRSIPDAWIYNNDGFALVFEAKITDTLTRQQLNSHKNTARKQGFENSRFYTITALPNARDFENWTQITWVNIYKWLRAKQPDHFLARHTADYFEILEARLHAKKTSKEFRMTAFTSFYPYYDNIYSYDLAKNNLGKAMDELRQKRNLVQELKMKREIPGRKSITGKDTTRVWDFLAVNAIANNKNFTNYLHLTLGINETEVEASITIPDKIITYQKNKIKNRGRDLDGAKRDEKLGKEKFIELCETILSNMADILTENPNAQPILRGIQRRYYPSQRSYPTTDTIIEADLRTAFSHYNGRQYPKYQLQWLEVIYGVFCKKKSNYQMQIGIKFPYEKCPNIKNANALDLIARSWIACKPLVELCQPENPD